jgi:hypothetical protein
MEHCCTIEGLPFSYLAVFILFCAGAVTLVVVLGIQIRDWFSRRDLERKYGVKVAASRDRMARSSGSDSGPSLHGYEHHDDSD